MNKFFKYLTFAAVFTLAFVATGAFADTGHGGESIFQTVLERLITTFQNVRSVIFVIGGFGLVGLAFFAIFGKVRWSWLAALGCGLAIVAAAGAVIDYATRADAGKDAYDAGDIGDVFY